MLDTDANKRMDQLANELTKTNANISLSKLEKNQIIKEKYEIIMYPIISILEHVNEITTNTFAEKPNEEKFTHEFGPKIQDAFKQLKNIDLNAFKPFNETTASVITSTFSTSQIKCTHHVSNKSQAGTA